jgi:protein TonB
MTTSTGFLARLGLEEGADERQVRRAYARELKQIDQERDLEGFQHLRACYEAALDWVAHRVAQAEPASVRETAAAVPAESPHVASQAPDNPEPVHPAVLGDAVFADFRVRMAALVVQPERMGRDESLPLAPWTAALREALADPRLLHLYARVVFEHRIAALLVDGWQSGHHLLLPAAIEIFGWDQDRRALERLGQAGAYIDEALEQRAMFLSQDILARTQQREVLHLLRQGGAPDVRTIRGYAAPLVMLTNYFPTLLGIVAPGEAAAAWRARVTDDMLSSVGPGAGGRSRPWWKGGSSPRLAAGIAIFFLIRLLTTFATHDTPQPSAGQAAHGFPSLGDEERRERLRHPKPIYEDERVTAERIEAIRKAIRYRPGKDVPPGEQAVEVQVVLDADGSILGLNTLKLQGDPAYAEAVAQAIRATGPFPPKTSKAFTLAYRATVTGRLTPERALGILKRVDYRPGKDASAGKQRVQFQVTLDEHGAILKMRTLVAPEDPAYAEAVEQAIRSTAPFAPETPRVFSIGFHTQMPRKPASAPVPPADSE